MGKAFKLIDDALNSGNLTESEHDKIMDLIHRDGLIDEKEQAYLSKLFQGISNGSIQISANPKKRPSSISLLTDEALQRDLAKEAHATPTDQIEKTYVSDVEPIDSGISDLVSQDPSTTHQDPSLDSMFGLELHGESRTEESQFKLASGRMLEANVKDRLWIKRGAMVAYRGHLSYRREGISEHGVAKLLKRGLTRESIPLTAAEGVGKLYLADQGKKISILSLQGTALYLQAQHVLAFESSVNWDIQSLFNIGTTLAGGLFHIRLYGKGQVAFCSRYEPLILRVTPALPLITDAQATVGWSSGLSPSIKTDVNAQTLIGRTSGESIQLRFEGDGIVIVQPYEEQRSE